MEKWSDRGAALIPYGDKIILMRRERGYGRHKKIYYTIPGGGKEEGETIRDTTIREIKEELGIDVELTELFMQFETSKRKQYIFIGKYINGVIGSGEGEEFEDNDYNENGGYFPELVSYNQFKKIRLVPLNLKRAIIKNFNNIVKVQDKENFENNRKNKEKNITKKVLRDKPRKNRHYVKKNKSSKYNKKNNNKKSNTRKNLNKDYKKNYKYKEKNI